MDGQTDWLSHCLKIEVNIDPYVPPFIHLSICLSVHPCCWDIKIFHQKSWFLGISDNFESFGTNFFLQNIFCHHCGHHSSAGTFKFVTKNRQKKSVLKTMIFRCFRPFWVIWDQFFLQNLFCRHCGHHSLAGTLKLFMYVWMYGLMDGSINRWTDGLMDEPTNGWTYPHIKRDAGMHLHRLQEQVTQKEPL